MEGGLSSLFYLLLFSFLFFLLSSSRVLEAAGTTTVTDGTNTNRYIVYMGAASSSSRSSVRKEDQAHQLLASVLKRKGETVERSLLHSYKHGFSGFAARLTAEEARMIAQKPGVVSVFVDPILKLHTTRSWDFLQYQNDLETHSSDPVTTGGGSDTIIGLLDTGIWPESESFQDKDMDPIPTRWKGVCMEAPDFKASNCNKKLIGARYYEDSDDASPAKVHEQTPRDTIGHGSHTASTAAGSPVENTSYYGLAAGTAKGGSSGSRIAVYKVCSYFGCRGSTIMAAFDDAIRDGVDVLSLSLGASSRPDYEKDPIAIGAFHAVEKGIIVVCSAGNDGPTSSTVVNAAPWILTVGATTIDRDFESDCVLGGGNNTVVKGEGINFSTLEKSPIYPLIYGGSAKSKSSSDKDARNCNPDALDGAMIKGKIVVCDESDGIYSKREKMDGVENLGGVGLVLVDDLERMVALTSGSFPMTVISSKVVADILSYINSTRNPLATILPTVSVTKYKPAPVVAYFSSRGPSPTKNILKPDIAAPGVNILAAWFGTNDTSEAPAGQKPSQFNFLSGTSMSCPHVSGIAATIKSKNPTWSPSAIKSAIMTTASQTNNERAPLTSDSGLAGTPYDFGAGEMNPSGALQPGLVYETDTEDYLLFLCNYGYNVSTIKNIASVIPNGFDCPQNFSTDLISNLNYPSIAISILSSDQKEMSKKVISRTATNVGPDEETTYVASILTPPELDVKVVPDKLQFTKDSSKKLSYQMIFSLSSPLKDDAFGSITWTNGKFKVRSPFVVSSS